jgi:hypothetical protein
MNGLCIVPINGLLFLMHGSEIVVMVPDKDLGPKTPEERASVVLNLDCLQPDVRRVFELLGLLRKEGPH